MAEKDSRFAPTHLLSPTMAPSLKEDSAQNSRALHGKIYFGKVVTSDIDLNS
jgi:hypothetical protein